MKFLLIRHDDLKETLIFSVYILINDTGLLFIIQLFYIYSYQHVLAGAANMFWST